MWSSLKSLLQTQTVQVYPVMFVRDGDAVWARRGTCTQVRRLARVGTAPHGLRFELEMSLCCQSSCDWKGLRACCLVVLHSYFWVCSSLALPIRMG